MNKIIIIEKATNIEHLADVIAIRKEVFIQEQNISIHDELEKDNYLFQHYILYFNGVKAATARMRKTNNHYIVGRLAVLKQYRSLGLGEKIMNFIHQEIKANGGNKIIIHAQLKVENFYKKLGYVPTSEIFYEANIPHVTMEKHL